jgi:hypothetical protein
MRPRVVSSPNGDFVTYSDHLERVNSPRCICGREHRPSGMAGTDLITDPGKPRKPGCRQLTWQELYERMQLAVGNRRKEAREFLRRAEDAEKQVEKLEADVELLSRGRDIFREQSDAAHRLLDEAEAEFERRVARWAEAAREARPTPHANSSESLLFEVREATHKADLEYLQQRRAELEGGGAGD